MTAAVAYTGLRAYLRNRSTLLAVVLHSIAGQLIYTSGLGVFFYHGAVAG